MSNTQEEDSSLEVEVEQIGIPSTRHNPPQQSLIPSSTGIAEDGVAFEEELLSSERTITKHEMITEREDLGGVVDTVNVKESFTHVKDQFTSDSGVYDL